MRIMGLDIGTKRIGLALSDELEVTAQGLPTLYRTTSEDDTQQLLSIAKQHKVKKRQVSTEKITDRGLRITDNKERITLPRVKEYEILSRKSVFTD